MANLSIDPPGKPVTGPIRFLSGRGGPILYMAKTEPATQSSSPLTGFQTVLAPVTSISNSVGSGKTPQILTLEQPFGSVPDWDLSSDRDGTLHLAHQIFGGGWNLLRVASVQNGTLQVDSVYGIGDCGFLRLVRDTSDKGASRVLVTCVLDRENLVLMLPGTPVSGGTVPIEPLELGPAGPGLAFADLSGDMPTRLDLLLKTEIRQGPLCPSGLFRGTLTLAGFDLSSKTPSIPTPLVPGTEVGELAAAWRGGLYCVLASLSNGQPLVFTCDTSGKIKDVPVQPFGDWSRADHWIGSPTVVADIAPGASCFRCAFVEYTGTQPVAWWSLRFTTAQGPTIPQQTA